MRILVVEDNPYIAKAIRVRLEHAGVQVDEAREGQRALSMVASARPDLILLDIYLPGGSGYTVLDRLKSNPDHARIPVVMLSAHATDAHSERAKIHGAEALLPKPIDSEQLLATVRGLLAAPIISNSESPDRQGSRHSA
ncbi:MAG: response regulator [Nitrospirota bacterium]|nr:response regulator [Nitrospirota bacterium]